MSSLNKVMLIGRVGKDPDVKAINDSQKVAKFSIATSESYKDKSGEKKENTEWHNIVMWGKLAETAEKYIKKGSLLYVEGKLQTSSWDDKDGKKCYKTEINVRDFTFLSSKSDGGNQALSTNTTSSSATVSTAGVNNQVPVNSGAEDDLPF